MSASRVGEGESGPQGTGSPAYPQPRPHAPPLLAVVEGCEPVVCEGM